MSTAAGMKDSEDKRQVGAKATDTGADADIEAAIHCVVMGELDSVVSVFDEAETDEDGGRW